MKALDAYRDVLRELDKYESPSFEIKEFNYFFPKAISRYIAQNYEKFDVIQKEVDDLRSIIKTAQEFTMDANGLVELPGDYRHMLHVKAKVKYKVAVGRFDANETGFVFPERMKSGQKGFRMRNAFGRPSYRRHYYELAGSSFQLIFDSATVAIPTGANLWLDYVSQPADPYLNPNKASDYNSPANNSVLFFNTGSSRNHVYYEIINVCREIFLENIESVRAPEATRQSLSQ